MRSQEENNFIHQQCNGGQSNPFKVNNLDNCKRNNAAAGDKTPQNYITDDNDLRCLRALSNNSLLQI